MDASKTITSRHFNSQPHKEADFVTTPCKNYVNYFNSQPHKEADGGNCDIARKIHISTHSLTRRLTGTASGDTKITVFQLTASQGG